MSSDFFSIKARVSVGPNVPVGLHDYRLRTPRGTHVGVFQVGSLPRLSEVEPNNDLKHAQDITLPAMIDGIVESDDYDVFRFHAEAGETLIFDVMATRAGSRLDSTITILDERGVEQQMRFERLGGLIVAGRSGGQQFGAQSHRRAGPQHQTAHILRNGDRFPVLHRLFL